MEGSTALSGSPGLPFRARGRPVSPRAAILAALLLPCALSSATLGPWVYRETPIRALRLVAMASWYHLPGHQTASGTPYGGLTAASRTLPFGERRVLCRADRPRVCVTVTMVDRFGADDPLDRGYDLSRAAARKLGMIRAGVIPVTVREVP